MVFAILTLFFLNLHIKWPVRFVVVFFSSFDWPLGRLYEHEAF